MPLRRIIFSSVAVALTMVGATVASAQDRPDPGLGIRLLEAPSARANDPRAKSYIVDFVAPGTNFTRSFEISNGSSRAMDVDLYGGAARVEGGAFVPEDRGVENRLTPWMTVTPAKARLAPGARKRAQVSVAVPASATAGEYYGAVWAEVPGVAPPGGGAAVANRVGIRVYLGVGAGGEPATSFKLESFAPSLSPEGRPGVDIRTCNDGGRAIDLTGELSLTEGPGGVSAGPFRGEKSLTLGPRQCDQATIQLDPKLPKGPWRASVKLQSGEDERKAEATITFPDEPGGGAPVDAEATEKSSAVKVALLVGLLVLLAVATVLFLLWRRRREADG
ncbi:MAG TPA: hypothetical protein VNA57_08180 [Acidimicrobiales bacterium]|nr:hypothetical protein [Acidimicrobiales bacterium]